MTSELTIETGNTGVRLDKYIADKFPQYSRSLLSKLIEDGSIKVNKKIEKPGYKLKEKDIIKIDLSKLTKKVDKIEIPIIYEDKNIIVINKPSGIISHARGRYWDEPSVASFIRDRLSEVQDDRTGIVHRLDRATSGVMICAKNPHTLSFLQKQFSNRTVKKTYIAKCHNKPTNDKAIIDAPIDRNPKKPTTFRVDKHGKSAQTEYEVINSNEEFCIIRFVPYTGRTHQIRIHASYIGTPIVGDTYYGDLKKDSSFDRLYLHAESLEIEVPNLGKKTFKATTPDEIIKL